MSPKVQSSHPDELKAFFRKFGDIKTCRIIYRHESNVSRGFGFVVFKSKSSAEEVIKRKDEHYLHGKWIDCKSAILRQEIEQDPVLAAQLAAKKVARRSPSPKKGSPPKQKKQSPQRPREDILDEEEDVNEKMRKFVPPPIYKHHEYSYQEEGSDYPYNYQGAKEGQYFSPRSYQWNNRYYEQQPYPRSYRHNPERENPRFRQHPQPPRDYQLPMMANPRVSPTNRNAFQQPVFPFSYYAGPEAPLIPLQPPIYGSYPGYISPNYRPPSPLKVQQPMQVPVIQDFSPPQRERYMTYLNEEPEEEPELKEPPRKQGNFPQSLSTINMPPVQMPVPSNPGVQIPFGAGYSPAQPDQAIKLNLNFDREEDEDVKLPETSKTLSPDRKGYNLFEGNKDSDVLEKPSGIMTRYIGMIGARVAEVNSSRNSPRQVEYKKYYSPTQKHRGEVVAKLFEKAITLKPQQTDKTTEKFSK